MGNKTKKIKSRGTLWKKILLAIAGVLLAALCIVLGIWPWVLGIAAGVLILVLFLLSLVLLVPVRYRAAAGTQEGLSVKGSISWLWHIVHYSFAYGREGFTGQLRVFGCPLRRSEKKRESKTEETERPEEPSGAPVPDQQGTSEKQKPAKKEPIPEKQKTKKEEKKRRPALRERIAAIREIWHKIKDNAATVKKLFHYLGRLLRPLWPRRCRLWLRFGMEDPAATGQILGAYHAIRPLVGSRKGCRLQIEPDFENKVFACDGWVRGWFFVGSLLWVLLRAFLDHDIQKAVRAFSKK